MVRFFAKCSHRRIYSFEFQRAVAPRRVPNGWLRLSPGKDNTQHFHRLQRRLPGINPVSAPHAFEPCENGVPPYIYTHFTAIDSLSLLLKLTSLKAYGSATTFNTDLSNRLRFVINRTNARTLYSAAAGTVAVLYLLSYRLQCRLPLSHSNSSLTTELLLTSLTRRCSVRVAPLPKDFCCLPQVGVSQSQCGRSPQVGSCLSSPW